MRLIMNIKRSLMDYPIGYKDYDKLGRESYKFSDSISLEHLSEFDLNAWNAGDWQTPMFKDMELSENLLFLTQVFYGDLTSKSYLISLDRPVSFHSEFRTTYPFKIEEDKLKFKIPVISKFQLLDMFFLSRRKSRYSLGQKKFIKSTKIAKFSFFSCSLLSLFLLFFVSFSP